MRRNAFALIEMLTVMGIIAILFALTVPQLFRLRDRNNLQTATTKFVSRVRQQQLNAMNSPQLYGMHLEQSSYTQFTGSVYSNANQTNIVTTLDYPIEIMDIHIPSSTLIFASGSGELVGYDESNHSFMFGDTVNSEQHTIQFNALGVPTVLQ
jgi:prepilin-type N-terminal cleavage/methylation domain-containing protein